MGGTIRLRAKGSSGGHNGLKSIEGLYGTGYHRLKLGIGGKPSKEHVVGEFNEDEKSLLDAVAKRATEAIDIWLSHGTDDMQTTFAKINKPEFCKVAIGGASTSKVPATTDFEAI